MEDAQYDDVAVCELVPNLVLRDDNAPDLPPPEARQSLAEARLRRYALDGVEDRTHSTPRRGGIDGLQEVVQPAEICIGRFSPPKPHRSAACIAATSRDALHPRADLGVVNRRAGVNFGKCRQCLSVTFLVEGEISLNCFLDDPPSWAFEPLCEAIKASGELIRNVCGYDTIAHTLIILNQDDSTVYRSIA